MRRTNAIRREEEIKSDGEEEDVIQEDELFWKMIADGYPCVADTKIQTYSSDMEDDVDGSGSSDGSVVDISELRRAVKNKATIQAQADISEVIAGDEGQAAQASPGYEDERFEEEDREIEELVDVFVDVVIQRSFDEVSDPSNFAEVFIGDVAKVLGISRELIHVNGFEAVRARPGLSSGTVEDHDNTEEPMARQMSGIWVKCTIKRPQPEDERELAERIERMLLADSSAQGTGGAPESGGGPEEPARGGASALGKKSDLSVEHASEGTQSPRLAGAPQLVADMSSSGGTSARPDQAEEDFAAPRGETWGVDSSDEKRSGSIGVHRQDSSWKDAHVSRKEARGEGQGDQEQRESTLEHRMLVKEARGEGQGDQNTLEHRMLVIAARIAVEEVLDRMVSSAANRASTGQVLDVGARREAVLFQTGSAWHSDTRFESTVNNYSEEKLVTIKLMFDAVESQDVETAKDMVFHNPWLINSVLPTSKGREQPLHVSASLGDETMTLFLLRQKPTANPMPRDAQGREALHCAVAKGHVRVALALLEADYFTCDARDAFGMTALHLACQSEPRGGFVQSITILVLALMKAGLDQEARCGAGVQNLPPSEGFSAAPNETCVHLSARALNFSALSLILSSGADLSKVSARGQTALHCALAHPSNTVKKLKDFHAHLGPARPPGASSRSEKEVFQCVRLLVEEGVGINSMDNKGKTGLMQAAHLGYATIVEYLLNKGADATLVDSTGKTALMYAAAGGSAQCLTALRKEHAASINVQCSYGNTAIHYAVMGSEVDCVKSILASGISDLTIKNRKGVTAKELAGDSTIGLIMQAHARSSRLSVEDPAVQVQRVFRGHLGRRAFREHLHHIAKHPTKKLRHVRHAEKHHKLLPRFLDQSGTENSWNMMDLHSVIASPEVEDFANMFQSGRDSIYGRSKEAFFVGSSGERYDLSRNFEGKYASRSLFERFAQWRNTGRSVSAATLVYSDLIALLDHTGLLCRHISKSEVFELFKHDEHSQPGTSRSLGKIGREMGFTEFRAHMRGLAGRLETQTLRILVHHTILSPPPSITATPRSPTTSLGAPAPAESPPAFQLPSPPPGLPPPPRTLTPLSGFWDYLPTVSGVNGSKTMTQAPRSTSPTLAHALRSFSPVANKVRVLPEATRHNRTAGGSRASTSFTRSETPATVTSMKTRSIKSKSTRRSTSPSKKSRAGSQAGSPTREKPMADFHQEGRASVDMALALAEQHSRLSATSSLESIKSRLYTTKNTRSWEATGCSQSRNELACKSTTAVVANLNPWLKQIWIDYAPAVAGKPELCDEAHEATYEQCLEASDYMGCYEVMVSSSKEINRGTHPELYERMHVQTLIFCNYYALRCVKARRPSVAIALLQKAEVLSTAGCGVDFPGRLALRGWTLDVFACYYLSRGKTNAAKNYMSKAMQIIEKQSAEGQITWKSHFSAVLSAGGKFYEAMEYAKDALLEALADHVNNGVLALDNISGGAVAHAQRKLASAASFNLAVCKVQTNRLADALTCTKIALALGEDMFETDFHNYVRMQGLHEALEDLINFRTGNSGMQSLTSSSALQSPQPASLSQHPSHIQPLQRPHTSMDQPLPSPVHQLRQKQRAPEQPRPHTSLGII